MLPRPAGGEEALSVPVAPMADGAEEEDLYAVEDPLRPLADGGPAEGEATPVTPLQVVEGRDYCSTGFSAGGSEQCRFVWRARRVSAAPPPRQFAVPQFLLSDDGYWDWWAANGGREGAVTARPLVHVCTESPCGVTEGGLAGIKFCVAVTPSGRRGRRPVGRVPHRPQHGSQCLCTPQPINT